MLACPGFAISARFTVQIHRSKASHGCRIANLGDFRGLAIVICHLCTLHRVNSAFKLLPQTPFAISAHFSVQIHRSKASHGCRIATLGDTDGQLSPCRSTLQEIGPYTPFAISAAFTVQIHASRTWHQKRANRVFRSTVQIHASRIWPQRQKG